MSQRVPLRTTLLELIETLCEITHDDAEVVATALHLLGNGTTARAGWAGEG